jgi:hypothetical protein
MTTNKYSLRPKFSKLNQGDSINTGDLNSKQIGSSDQQPKKSGAENFHVHMSLNVALKNDADMNAQPQH